MRGGSGSGNNRSNVGASNVNRSDGIVFCKGFQRGTCQQSRDHYGQFYGQNRLLKHICGNCWLNLKTQATHPETSDECPLKQQLWLKENVSKVENKLLVEENCLFESQRSSYKSSQVQLSSSKVVPRVLSLSDGKISQIKTSEEKICPSKSKSSNSRNIQESSSDEKVKLNPLSFWDGFQESKAN